ncbi:MAG TPA: sugar ABC transporter substrate-binding protein [Clostridia bacterium]|nr:sugar ABC transporter substrate-binding protein [Clostridia bacterium]
MKQTNRNKMRRAVGLLLMLAMLFAFTACSTPSGETDQPVNTQAPAENPTDAPAQEPTEGERIKIGVSTDTAVTVFRKIELMGLYSAAEAAGNVDIIELVADDDTTTQYTQFKSLIDQGVDVIVCCAIDQDAILTAYDYAQAAGVPVINYDRKVEHDNVAFTAMYDSYSDAKQLAEYLISLDDGEEHTIFLTVGSLADPNGIARREGFQDTIAASGHTNLKVVEIMTDWDVDKALTNMQNALQVYKPWAVANVSAHMDGSCYQALEEAGLKIKRGEEGHVYYTSLSGEPPAVQYMEDGYTDKIFVIPADTAGQAIFDAAMTIVNGGTPESDVFYMPTFGVGPDELEAKADEIWTIKYADLLG